MTRRRPTPDETRAAITHDLWAEWLPPEPAPPPPPCPYPDEAALLVEVGREGLEHARQMRRRLSYGGLVAD